MQKMEMCHNGELYSLGALLYGCHHTLTPVALTPQEQRVLGSLWCHGSVTETAKQLRKSVKTVSAQKRSIMNKLGVANEVALFALRNLTETSGALI
ncbi:hypothetical protein GHV41_07020 [Serratia proteamaculans]|uniref:HTH luxR-type domain-containing protein n=2 Tax=Serratia proteamaculans TaxID=28151 RepID=A0A5Q2VIH8_SERPR|nr:hypothetical protein GHV41_07020 [Serratia proteamaculans]